MATSGNYFRGKRYHKWRRRGVSVPIVFGPVSQPITIGKQALGDIASEIGGAFSSAAGVLSDPYFTEVTCHVGQLQAIKAGRAATPCPEVPMGLPGGVGLDKVALGMRAYVFAEENPIVYPLAALLVFGIPFLIGYRLGGG